MQDETIEITDSSELTEEIDDNIVDSVPDENTDTESIENESKEEDVQTESSDDDETESTDTVETESSDIEETDTSVSSDNIVDTSSFDYTESLQTIIQQNETTNELLVRINNQNDFIIALAVTFIISMICYKILHGFTKV